jgi:hypothetical protein
MKRFTIMAAVAAGLLAAAPSFAQTAAESTKQPAQSLSHSDPSVPDGVTTQH